MPYQLSEINEKIRRDPAAFLAECDAHYQERIHAAVSAFIADSGKQTAYHGALAFSTLLFWMMAVLGILL